MRLEGKLLGQRAMWSISQDMNQDKETLRLAQRPVTGVLGLSTDGC